MKRYLLVILFALIASSCEVDVNEGTVWNNPHFIRISVSTESIKIGADDNYPYSWTRNDSIVVFDNKGAGVKLENRDNSAGAIFFSYEWTGKSPLYAVYSPAAEGISSPQEGVFTARLGNEQEIGTLQKFGSNAIASVGKINGNKTAYKISPMRNISGFLRLSMIDSTATSIVVESVGGEIMSGDVLIDYAKIETAAEDFWTPDPNGSQYSSVLIKAESESAAATVDACLKPGSYLVSVLPQMYEQGLRITVNYEDGTSLVRNFGTDYGVKIPRSELSSFEGALDDTLLDVIEIKLQFHNEQNINPLGTFPAYADQKVEGELYIFPYQYEFDGNILTEEIPFVLSKGGSNAYYRYSEVSPNGYFFRVNQNDGWIKLPGLPGRFLKSVSMTHGNTSNKRFRIQEGNHTLPGKYKSSPNLAATSITNPVTETVVFPTGTSVSGEINATEVGRSYYMQFTSGVSLVCYDITLVYAKSL